MVKKTARTGVKKPAKMFEEKGEKQLLRSMSGNKTIFSAELIRMWRGGAGSVWSLARGQ